MKHVAYILLGSNLGDRNRFLEMAREFMETHCGDIIAVSQIYETEPLQMISDLSFLNQAVKLETQLNPDDLLKCLNVIERKLGRIRTKEVTSRTIDLDIGLYDNLDFKTGKLTIPHPRLHKRNFVLAPLSEIAGNVNHPVLDKTISDLYKHCSDHGEVSILAES